MESRLLKHILLFLCTLLVFGAADRALAQTLPRRARAAIAEPLQVHWNDESQLSAAQATVPQGASQAQAVSQTGVLPVFAVDMEIDASWVDGDAAPSTSPQFSHSGVNDTLDQAWATLKPSGFDMIRFPVHLEDPKSPVRLANLCLWAKANNITLIPVLQGTAAMRSNSPAMASALGTFIANVLSRLRGGDGSALATYTQIGFYQLERPMNHAGLYPNTVASAAQQLLLAASAALRQAETQALQGTGVQATPISVSGSFDFELIQQGAIAGVPLDPGAEQRAQDSLKQYWKGLASPNIDAFNVEWFPRSVSSGDVDHFVTLLSVLKQTFAGKQLTLTTGFSSAFNSSDQALQFYAVAISNLGSFRASEGVDSKFVGVVFQQAFKGTNADALAPSGSPDPSQWKWSDRAQQLSAMWSKGTASPDMAWWVSKVQDNMGLIAVQPNGSASAGLTPLPSLQAFQVISSTLTQASQQVQPPASYPASAGTVSPMAPGNPVSGSALVPPPAATGYVPGAQATGQVAGSPFQQLLFSLLQEFTQQIAAKLTMKLGGSNQPGQNYNAGYSGVPPSSASASPYPASNSYANATPPSRSSLANTVWIGPSDVNLSTTTPPAGQPVVVTAQVHNQSADQDISGLTVELLNPSNPSSASQSMQGGITVPRSGVTPVQLSWAPDASSVGQVQLLLRAMDSNGQVVTSVAIPTITVQGSNTSANSASSGNIGTSGNLQVTAPTDSGSSANSSLPNTATSLTNSGNSSSGANPTTALTAQLAVTGFGPVDPNASAAGQIPQLTAQVSNPSQIPTQSGQAQLFMDGTPQQMQTLGTLLPSGTLPLQFSPIQAPTGQHNVQLVVTTADGVSASATFAANVTTASASNSSGNSSSGSSQTPSGGSGKPSRSISVRAAAPTVFQIGNVMRATTSSPRGTMLVGNSGGTVATPPPATTAQSQSLAPSANSGASVTTPSRTSVATSINANPGPATMGSATSQTTPASRVPAVRTITPGTASTNTTAPGATPSSQASIPSSTSAAVPAAGVKQGTVRTITPGSVSTANQPPNSASGARTATQPSAGGAAIKPGTVRTIAPPPSSTTPPVPATSPGLQTPAGVTRTITPSPSGPTAKSLVPPSQNVPSGAAGKMDIGISPLDVHLIPFPPKPGQTTTFTAAIKNVGTVAAQGASVVFILVANGQRVAASQPMMFNVGAHGVFQARWTAPLPAAANLQLVVTVVANGDVSLANNQAIVPIAFAPAPVNAPLKPH